ncbi:MAG TPA: asparagine synthase (glutamine-hydrolyzing) [Terriglobales bacterium]|jgi:asparagine synthase (glutamine-hydrolysing)|nr:asparagine synthase (glutamine-hydrolyzing) [Terriglobales bacterium]
MCGIAGLHVRTKDDGVLMLDSMLDMLHYRGPDDRGQTRSGPWHMGMVRLAILDPERGNQPVFSRDSRWVLVFNGEIYNFLRLREDLLRAGTTLRTKTDTEVLVELISQRGVLKTLEAIEGMFAFAALDGQRNEIWLARDRFGEKPLFIDRRDGDFAFCSEISPLLSVRSCGRQASARGLTGILRHGFPYPGTTAIEHIEELKPAYWLRRTETGTESCGAYWAPPPCVDDEVGPLNRCATKLLELLDESVRDRLVADVPLGLFLSGGIDSAAVAQAASRTRPDIEAVTVGFQHTRHDERPLSRATARSLGITLHEEQANTAAFSPALVEELLLHYGQPFADTSAIPTRIVSRAARRRFKVVLSGDGGDELLCGYPSFVRLRRFARWGGGRAGAILSSIVSTLLPDSGRWESASRALKLNASLKEGLLAYISDGVFTDEQVLSLVEGTEWSRPTAEQLNENRNDSRRTWFAANDPLLALSLHQLRTSFPQDILMKVDRMSMAESLEVRAPFLDSRFASYALSLPAHLKMNGLLGKFVLRHALKGRIPEPVLSAPKHGFTLPVRDWMGPIFWQELRRELTSYATDSAAELNTTALRQMVEVDEHRCRTFESYRALHRAWLLYTYFRWRNRWCTSAQASQLEMVPSLA